ncbi:MAG TPA: type VI secretion system baseplate subunit TssG [Steroidobacteraceae bacterium]|nr:type VI secretion system baseplate subunit TssG [Steroidobacteraceae bacterium]
MGRATDPVALLGAIEKAPYAFDFYETLRRLECAHGDKPRWGQALRPADEPVRFGQEPSLSFAPTALAAFEAATETAPPRISVYHFGLLGPNGPLPLHLTEYARDRLRNHGDPTFARFLDLLQHRFIVLLYRAWAQAQPHVNLDRPADDHYATYLGALYGGGTPAMRGRDAVPDYARLHYAGILARQVRNAEGLTTILAGYFRVPAEVETFVGHWLELAPAERTQLGGAGATLGSRAVLGQAVWDRQHKFRIVLGPLALDVYKSFLPGGSRLHELVDWVRTYLGFELDWDLKLKLRRDEVPLTRLGGGTRLGWTSWLGHRQSAGEAADLCLDAETQLARVRGTA